MARQKNDGRGRLGGRQKGTPNKSTQTIREAITDMWRTYSNSGQFAADIAALQPAERAVIMEKYAQYISPKMKSVDLDMGGSLQVDTIEDRLRRLCDEDR